MATLNGNNSSSSSFAIHGAKTTYHILGEDVQVQGSKDGTTAMMICTLNVLGRPFYEEMKKNGICFPPDIENHLQLKFSIEERDEKIEEILKSKQRP